MQVPCLYRTWFVEVVVARNAAYRTVPWLMEAVVAVETTTMVLQDNRMVCAGSGGSRDHYHGLTGQ